MHTVLVTYTLPEPRPRADILAAFETSAPRFRAAEHLLRKYFCYDETTGTGLSVYLWDSGANARAFHDAAFADGFRARFNADPRIAHHDTLVIVDNEQGETRIGAEADT